MNVHLKNALMYGLPGVGIGYGIAVLVHRPNEEGRKVLKDYEASKKPVQQTAPAGGK